MKILFSNNETIDFCIDNSPLGQTYQKIYKHLSAIPIPHKVWDNPYRVDRLSYKDLVDDLVKFGNQLQVEIDQERCLAQDQLYFNHIHKIYETNYNGNPDWLDFHESIHECERFFQPSFKIFHINYREKAGPLEKPCDPLWFESATTTVKAGEIFSCWAELGKSPYEYWYGQEPNDIDRMCQLCKPWLQLRPKLNIALEDIDFLKNKKISEFESWWKDYSEAWCQHWNIPSWTVENIFSATVIGRVDSVEPIIKKLKSNIAPVRVLLE